MIVCQARPSFSSRPSLSSCPSFSSRPLPSVVPTRRPQTPRHFVTTCQISQRKDVAPTITTPTSFTPLDRSMLVVTATMLAYILTGSDWVVFGVGFVGFVGPFVMSAIEKKEREEEKKEREEEKNKEKKEREEEKNKEKKEREEEKNKEKKEREEEKNKETIWLIEVSEDAAGTVVKTAVSVRRLLKDMQKALPVTQAGDSLAPLIYRILYPGSKNDASGYKLYLARLDPEQARALAVIGRDIEHVDDGFLKEESLGKGAADAISSDYDVFIIKP